jgi:hypothetical protein
MAHQDLRIHIPVAIVIVMTLGSKSAFAWDAAKRLTVFEAAHQEALMCNRDDLYKNLSSKIQSEFKASTDALYNQGREKGLSDLDAKIFGVKAADRIRQSVARDYLPSMRKNEQTICNSIENRFISHYQLISKD